MPVSATPALEPVFDSPDRPRPPILAATDWNACVTAPLFQRLLEVKRRTIGWLLGGSLAFFFVMMFLAGYARPFMTTKVFHSLNVGYVLIFAMYLICWCAALIYTFVARTTFDPLAAQAARAAEAQVRRAAR